jgi:hypothetical protein
MKNKFFAIVLVAIISVLWACSPQSSFKVDQTYHGFKLVEKKFVKEANANCLYFIHEKSGARLLKIEADDANKLFNIAFKTLPAHDYGTPHILEHSVLNGSESFPVKSPFDILTKGSLNTFLNAMTSSDFTTYPVASMNDKDYFNLMHVYLDAVFKPLLHTDDRILKQEGWHYELDDINGDIIYKGVVYNEMKGAFSSPDRELGYQIDKTLFPDNTYGVSSGGYPSEIPGLTLEYFRNFHKTYYHPSNSYILLYGDADLNKELEFIDTAYLSGYEKSDEKVEIPLQKPFEAKKSAVGTYPVPEGSSVKDKTFLSYSVVIGKNTDQELGIALNILRRALVSHESAPLRLAIQEAKIGKDIYAYVDDIQQNVLHIVIENANPEDKDRFEEILFNTLTKVGEEGFEQETIDGIVNRYEFNMREGNTSNKGMMYLWRSIGTVMFAENPFLGLEFEAPLAAVKEGLKNGLLENIIKEQIIPNPHALTMVLKPEQGLQKKIEAKEKKELAAYKASLSKEQLEQLVAETKELKEYQQSEDSPEDVATVPMLELSDISPEVEWYDVEEKTASNVPVLFHEDFTNNILYTNLYFDLRALPQDLIPYANLLAELIGTLNTEKYDFGALDNALNIHTGGFYTYINTYKENNDDSKLIPKFIINSKATVDKGDKLFKLAAEILNNTKYDDVDRLKDVLVRHQAQFESMVKNNGIGIAMTRLSSYYNQQGMFDELTNGLEYYNFITDLVNNFDEKNVEVSEKLAKTASILFNQKNMIANITCSKDNYTSYETGLNTLIATLPEGDGQLADWKFDYKIKNEGLMSTSKVQYVIKGYDFKKLGYEYNGKMRVLNQILSREYLQTQVRVIGGAYGGFAGFSSSGNVYFGSYRDPNLKKTLDNYDATPEFIKTFEADTNAMTRFIIGTIARMDKPTTASQRGSIAARRFFTKTTLEELQAERAEVLSTSPEDIKSFEKMVTDILAQEAICVYGNDEKIKENKSLFKDIYNVTK